MNVNHFSTPNLGLILISLALIFFLFYLWRVAKKYATVREYLNYKKPVLLFSGIYFLYLFVISVLAGDGFFSVVTTPPRMILIFAPVLITVLILFRSNRSLSFLQFISPWLFVAVQSFRIVVEFILAQFYHDGIVPVELTFYGRNFDIITGVLAIPTGILLYKRYQVGIKAGIWFNLIGLISLINILAIAIPSVPSSFRFYEMNYLPTYFPGILIMFIAPMAIYFHVLSLRQLLSMNKRSKAAPVF